MSTVALLCGAVAIMASLSGCASKATAVKHPLAGRIVNAQSGTSLSRESLLDEMSVADVVYLGEKHDNAVHHQLQLRLLSELVRRGFRPALGLEMFAVHESGALMAYVNAATASDAADDDAEARLRAATGMQDAADARWSSYGPLLQLARTHKLGVFGIDLPIALRQRMSRVGIDGLSPVERSVLPHGHRNGQRNTDEAGLEYGQRMMARFKAAHCGFGDAAYLQRLLQIWQARNETIARAIAATASVRDTAPVVVIVGRGHVHGGEGVVPRVAAYLPGARQVIVSFTEVDEQRAAAALYLPAARSAAGEAPGHRERLWFTATGGLSMDNACRSFLRGRTRSG